MALIRLSFYISHKIIYAKLLLNLYHFFYRKLEHICYFNIFITIQIEYIVLNYVL